MSTTTVDCKRDDCPQSFTVDESQDSARCSGCGTKHTPPWNTPDTVAADGGATIEAPANATVRITIEVVPGDDQ